MGQVALALVERGTAVSVRLEEVEGGARRELEHTLLLSGGLPAGGGYKIPVFTFRRSAVELAQLLRRLEAEVVLDEGVEALLRTQLEEIRQRRDAESALQPVDPERIDDLVRADARFRRGFTEQQEENLGRLLALKHGANFSVPGAGKTTTLLGIYEAQRGAGVVDRLLVVAPKNAFISWEDEVDECFEEARRPRVQRLSGGKIGVDAALRADPEIALITYQLLPNVVDAVKAWAFSHRTHVALDESHRVKAGYSGVTAGAALSLAEVAIRRDILSGTPLPHSPEDLRPQLDFLWPGQRILPDFRLVADAPEEIIATVEQSVRPLYVRTTKAQLDLPPLEVVPIPVELGPLQRELYDVMRSEAARVASGMRQRDRRFFRQLGHQVVRLLQTAVNPMLLTKGALVSRDDLMPAPEGSRAWELLRELARYEQPAKVTKAVERAEQVIARGDKVLIWSSFVDNLLALEDLLREHEPVLLYGAVPTGEEGDSETREGRIHRFHQDPTCRVMIANPAAAGEGISLHQACHFAIYLDRSFNAAHFLQSVDRIHRLGLRAGTITRVEVLEARGTIDQRVTQRLGKKIEAMSRILNDPGLASLAYDPADIEEEFDAGIEPEDIEEILDHLTGEPEEE